MALTQITTKGIKDGTILGADLTTNVDLVDNQKIRFGTGNDLQIYHDGSDSYIKNTGTGNLRIASSDFIVLNGLESQFIIRGLSGGTTELYHAGDKKLETKSTGAQITGQLQFADGAGSSGSNMASFGTSDDLKIFHNGSNSFIKHDGTGALWVYADDFNIGSPDGTQKYFNAVKSGAVELYFNNNKKFNTTNDGGTLTGNLFVSEALQLNDNKKIEVGNSADLEIYHNGTDTFIDENTGNLAIRTTSATHISLKTNNENAIFCGANGAVQLYHNNIEKFVTDSSGSVITGRLAFNNTGSSIQLADNQKATFGNGQDLQIFHDGSQSIIRDVGTGSLILQGSQVIMESADGGEVLAKFIDDGAVELYHNNVKKFETWSGGSQVHGSLHTDELFLQDNEKIKLGASDDLQIFSDGTNGQIRNHVGGGIFIRANRNVQLMTNASDGGADNAVTCVNNGGVELYFDNSKKFQTTSGGISVSGDISVEDNSFIRVRTTGDNTSTAIQLGHDGTATFSGNVGIGTTSPSAVLHVVAGGNNLRLSRSSFDDFQFGIGTVGSINGLHISNTTDNFTAFSISESGHIFAPNLNSGSGHNDLRYLTSTGQIFFDSSTRLVKTDIQDCSYGLAQIQQLKPRIYKRTDADNAVEIGLIADEVQGVLPEIVATEQKSFFTKNESDTEIIPSNVDLKRLTVVLIKGIQELAAEVAALKAT